MGTMPMFNALKLLAMHQQLCPTLEAMLAMWHTMPWEARHFRIADAGSIAMH